MKLFPTLALLFWAALALFFLFPVSQALLILALVAIAASLASIARYACDWWHQRSW